MVCLRQITSKPLFPSLSSALHSQRALHSRCRGRTALGEACAHEHTDIVTFLISAGASLDIRSMPFGRTALQIAADTGQTPAPQFFRIIRINVEPNPGNADIVRLLLQQGADVNVKNDKVRNSTPLHWASSKGHLHIMKMLLEVAAAATQRAIAALTNNHQHRLFSGRRRR